MIRFFQAGQLLLCGILWGYDLDAAPVISPEPVPAGAMVPSWPAVRRPPIDQSVPAVQSQALVILHGKSPVSGFIVSVAGQEIALGSAPLLIGYVHKGEMRWLDCSTTPLKNPNVVFARNGLAAVYECNDPDGATWRVERHFQPGRIGGSIEVQTDIRVDQDRSVAFVPLLLLFPGAGSFGHVKGQGLFAGLEYLDNEPSSSEADVIGPAAKRQVPDNLKITFPLMALQHEDRFVALTWQMRPFISALFDTPDRLFHSGGHVMGVLFPGSDGQNRQEGNLLPRMTELVHGGQTLTSRANILGGRGSSVVTAVQQFVQLRPLPPVPGVTDLPAYTGLAGAGWLASKIRQGSLVRHAIANGGFQPQPAADAALWMEWLAGQETDSARAERLRQTATNLLSVVPPADLNTSGIGHVRYPVASLVFGHVAENAGRAEEVARSLLGTFEKDGGIKYHPKPGGPDYAKTYFTNEASGLASRVVLDCLVAASFAGNRELIDAALLRLRALDRFHNGVPRGAQTWECPLHIPDVLASAQMARAYTLGYELTGETHFLDEARYWAWTGVPFVYLVSPTDLPVGLYATIPVFGATNWRAPVWLGLPVQWCGLVYADALYHLVAYDPAGPWKRIADGITASGIQQSWPQQDQDFQGLLPDSFVLRSQKRNGPAINPATLESCAAQFFTTIPVYDFHAFKTNALLVHAPGAIKNPGETKHHVRFEVDSWVQHPYYVLINGVKQNPKLLINNQSAEAGQTQFSPNKGQLVLNLHGRTTVELELQ